MTFHERALVFDCAGDRLIGVLGVPAQAASRAVVIVVGGPQYRAGSHRQFTLLARDLSAAGFPTLRFDYRGMGDSEGELRNFEHVNEDIRAAIDALLKELPATREIVLWGLCDAASAAMFYAHRDARVSGIAVANPWVRTEAGIARAYLTHYYARRIFDREFWSKVKRGEFRAATAIGSVAGLVNALLGGKQVADGSEETAGKGVPLTLPERMAAEFRRFGGRALFVLSGEDLTAQEFKQACASSRQWQRALASTAVTRRDLPEANHTFSRREWRDTVARWTIEWLRSW